MTVQHSVRQTEDPLNRLDRLVLQGANTEQVYVLNVTTLHYLADIYVCTMQQWYSNFRRLVEAGQSNSETTYCCDCSICFCMLSVQPNPIRHIAVKAAYASDCCLTT